MKYDAVIIGSGPAGSVTARFAAEKGAKVLIVERRAEVGVPVLCGEGISQKVDNYKILEGKRWIATKMIGARIFSPNGTKITLAAEYAGNETGYVVYRDIFDQELARGALEKGAEIMLNTCAVNLLKKNGHINGITAQHFDETIKLRQISWLELMGLNHVSENGQESKPHSNPMTWKPVLSTPSATSIGTVPTVISS